MSVSHVYQSCKDVMRRPHVYYTSVPYPDKELVRLAKDLQFKQDMLIFIESLKDQNEQLEALNDAFYNQGNFLYIIFHTKSSINKWYWKNPDQVLLEKIQEKITNFGQIKQLLTEKTTENKAQESVELSNFTEITLRNKK